MSPQKQISRREFLRGAGLALVGATLAACGGQAPTSQGTPAAPVAPATPAAAPAAPTAPAAISGGGEKVVIWRGGPSVPDDDPILQAIEQATNTDIQVLNVGQLTEKVNAGIASGDIPDVICTLDHNGNRALIEQWARDGVVAAFDGDVAAAAPNIVAQYEQNPVLNELKIEGKIYMQPVFWGNGFQPNAGLLHVRKDLLDKYGMEPPQSFDQYFAFLRAAKKDGQPGVLFYGEGGPGFAINAFVGAFGVPATGWVKVGDRYEYALIQPGIRDGLLLFRAMVNEGLINPVSWEGGEMRDKYVAGEGAALIFNGGGHIGRIQIDMDLAGKGAKEWLLAAPHAGGSARGYTKEPMFWGVTLIGNMKKNNPVAAARVLNFLVSEEGTRLTALGIPGRDYEGTSLDTIKLNVEQRVKDGFPAGAGDTGAHPLATEIVSWVPQELQDFALLYGKDETFKQWYRDMRKNQTQYVIDNVGQLSTSPQWSAFLPTGNELMGRSFLAIVQSPSENEAKTLFDQFVQEWKAAGGEQAQQEMSEVLSKLYG
jgi:putative aldouronate transport system substrate-binding protein